MELLIIFGIGILIGGMVARWRLRLRPVGSLLIINNSDPDDDPYLFLELSTNVDDIRKEKHVTLKVSHK